MTAQVSTSGAMQVAPARQGAYRIDTQAIAAFDAAVAPFELDQQLHNQIVGNELGESMAALVAALRQLSFERLTKRYSWIAKLTGADLQARIEFDLAAHTISDLIDRAYAAARHGSQMLQALQAERARLAELAPRHEDLLNTAETLLRGQDPQDELVARFQRRVANLSAMCNANRLSEAQLDLTIRSVTHQLDRFGELRKVLLPAWQQHALAIAQATSGIIEEYQQFRKFQEASAELADYLTKQGA